MKRFLVAVVAFAFCAPTFARAQYRADVPTVMQPPPQPVTNVSDIIGKFRNAYVRRGKPRLVIFWNRDFSAQMTTPYDHYSTTHTQMRGKDVTLEDTAQSDEGTTKLTKHEGGEDIDSETHSGVRDVNDNGAGQPDADGPAAWECEGAFVDSFTAVPTRLIDRAMAMRTSASGLSADKEANLQAIEARALMAKADLIVEALGDADPGSPSGYTFKVDVRDVKSGAIVVSFTTQAIPVEASDVHYVAGPEGFERAKPNMTVGIIGHELALETMQRLAAAW
jgi:hypothetical protein